MTYAISSAKPTELFAYNVKGRVLDAALVVHSGVLRATLQFFEVTCREPAFRMQVSHTADWMASHAHDSERVDDRVGQVGAGFQMADTAIGMAHAAVWAVSHIIDARNWVADRADELESHVVALKKQAEETLIDAAKQILEIAKLAVVVTPALLAPALVFLALPIPRWLSLPLIAMSVAGTARSFLTPPRRVPPIKVVGYVSPEQPSTIGEKNICQKPFVLPTNAAQWFDRVMAVPEDEPIQIVDLGNNQYMVLIKGTAGWYGHSRTWGTNLYSGLGYPSVYSARVKQLIEEKIGRRHPPATLFIAGHSQGGHVAQIVANDLAESGNYAVGAMFSYGAYFVTKPSDKIGNAQAFLFANDPLNIIDSTYDQYVGGETILTDGTKLNPIDAHGDYGKSETLKAIEITYDPSVNRTPNYESFTAPEESPVTGAIHDAVVWGNGAMQSTVDGLSDLSSEVANSVSDDYHYISNQIVTDGQHFGNTLQDFGDMITSTVDDLGVL